MLSKSRTILQTVAVCPCFQRRGHSHKESRPIYPISLQRRPVKRGSRLQMHTIQLSGNESDIRSLAHEIRQEFGKDPVDIGPITPVGEIALTARPVRDQNPYAECIIHIAEGVVVTMIVEFIKTKIGTRKISLTTKKDTDRENSGE